MCEVGGVEETMHVVAMAFGGWFEFKTVGAVVENPVLGNCSFPGPDPVRFRLRCSRKATKHMSAMSATPPPTAPPMMALVGTLEEVFLFHDLLLLGLLR